MNEHSCEVSFVCRKEEKYYLLQINGAKTTSTLLYKNSGEKKAELVFDFYDFFIAEGDQLKSSRNILARTHKLIDELNEEEKREGGVVPDMLNVYQMSVLFDNSYAVMLVEMKKRTGLMLVNVLRAQK
jgi:hypothetical protein